MFGRKEKPRIIAFIAGGTRGKENRSVYYSLLENTTATWVPSFCMPTVTITDRF
jgi:hypothetical protein